MKEFITSRTATAATILILTVTTGCTPIPERSQNGAGNGSRKLLNSFTVEPQVSPPQEIQSIQLYRAGSAANPPIINLDTDERLMLEFDHLGSQAKQFKASVQHYTRQWQESSLSQDFYMDSFYEDYFGAGQISFVERPDYRHYEYELPNQQLRFTVSGNYLLSIRDADSNQLLFAIPFFVSEDEGELATRVERRFARREDLRQEDQLYSQFRYPDFVEMPQFDLSFSYVQNQFWGRARDVQYFDTSTPGFVEFHLSRDEAFLGDYEFNTLDIRSFTASGQQILSHQPEMTPPLLILRRDVQNLSPIPAFTPPPRFGLPIDDRNARYADVRFHLELGRSAADTLQQVFLVGDFNGWSIRELNRMEFNRSAGLWEGNAFIKQGEYAYKYVVLENGRIDDLALDRSYTFRSQNYTTLVYFRDPVRHHDRLLKVDHISNR